MVEVVELVAIGFFCGLIGVWVNVLILKLINGGSILSYRECGAEKKREGVKNELNMT